MSKDRAWKIIAHGGAKDISSNEEQTNRDGMYPSIHAGAEILGNGGSALDAVEAVVKLLESNPAYNAGLYGCVRNEDGKVELSASIMDGTTLDIGAVANIHDIEHPVSVARALLNDKAIFLAGEGAMKFAASKGFDKAPLEERPEIANGCDTVGCVALDSHGNLAAATSTAGLEGSRKGRISDVPMPGCGFYADNTRGALSTSAEGEAIARIMLGTEFLYALKEMDADKAAEHALEQMKRVKGEAGIIAITADGRICWNHNSKHFAVGMMSEGEKPYVFLKKGEEK